MSHQMCWCINLTAASSILRRDRVGPHTEQNRMVWYGMVQDRTGQDRGLRHWTDDGMQSVAVCSAYAEEDVKCSQQ